MKRLVSVFLAIMLCIGANAAFASSSTYNIGKFATTTLEGEAVDQTMFAEHRLTMLNVWATYCNPCIAEMPELGKIAKDYADRGVQVVGVISDAFKVEDQVLLPDETKVEGVPETLKELGADYTHIMPNMALYINLLRHVSAVPTTLFLDSEGNQVGYAYSGYRNYEEWSKILDDVLTLLPAEV